MMKHPIQTRCMAMLPPILLVFLGWCLYLSTGRDDKHITYWSAYTLAQFGEIVNYSGERVEQSSSLLLVLVLAVLHHVTTIDLTILGVLASVGFSMVCLIVLHYYTRTIDPSIVLPTTLLTATSVPLVYWSFSGMETSLTALTGVLVLWAYESFLRLGYTPLRLLSVIATTLAFVLARPETMVVLGCILAGSGTTLLLYTRFIEAREPSARTESNTQLRLQRLLGISFVAGAMLLTVFLFRYAYFGTWIPQPVIAKTSGSENVLVGWYYFSSSYRQHGLFLFLILFIFNSALAGYALFHTRSHRLSTLLPTMYVLAYSSFAILSGGDWMEAGRFLVPVLPILILLSNQALARISVWLNPSQPPPVLLVGFLLLMGSFQVYNNIHFATSGSTGTPIWSRDKLPSHSLSPDQVQRFSWAERYNLVHRRDIIPATMLLELVDQIDRAKDDTVTLVSWQMGMMPFHTTLEHWEQVQFTDLAGLTDRRLTACGLDALYQSDTRGLRFRTEVYLRDFDAVNTRCSLVPPDIIYDTKINTNVLHLLYEHDYVLVFLQTGKLRATSDGQHISGTEFIAVRHKWARNHNFAFRLVQVGDNDPAVAGIIYEARKLVATNNLR